MAITSITDPWYLVACQPRTELRIAAALDRAESPHYLPLISRRTADRHTVKTPLFPRYLFATDPDAARKTHLTIAVQSIADQPRIQRELMAIETLLAAGLPLVREFRAGEAVRVCRGPLMGWMATVDHSGSNGRVHVHCHALGTVIAAEVPADHLERVEVAA